MLNNYCCLARLVGLSALYIYMNQIAMNTSIDLIPNSGTFSYNILELKCNYQLSSFTKRLRSTSIVFIKLYIPYSASIYTFKFNSINRHS